MANKEQLNVLRQGAHVWNEWRAKIRNINIQPDLSGAILSGAILSAAHLDKANLSEADLSEADLRGADLSGADLSGADLTRADLYWADLGKAHLGKAILRKAHLGKANLSEADLSGANLSEADLRENTQIDPKWRLVWQIVNGQADKSTLQGADLSGADLGKAILRKAHLGKANLSEADLSGANLSEADLSEADLSEADLSGAIMYKADLRKADLRKADLRKADLRKAILHENTQIDPKWRLVWQIVNGQADKSTLQGADLSGADLSGADLSGADLSEADLSGADLTRALLVQADLTKANLSGCHIFGVSAWGVTLNATTQANLVITDDDEPTVTVDNLEVAQFIYLLLHNEKIRDVIDTITSKAVLILGRFTPERKVVLDALREELRKRNYTPILFDFERPSSRDLTETVMTLASMARFVIADLSDPNSIPHEVMSFARQLLSVPVQAIFCPVPEHKNEYPMYKDLQRLPHVLPIYRYESQKKLIDVLYEKVIQPAEEKVKELRPTS